MDFAAIDKKWQEKWEKDKAFESKISKKKKFYVLEMFPYPSGTAHVGHIRNYSMGDCFARFKRMQGFNIIYPMGWDSFGLPAENAAIKRGIDPDKWTDENIASFKKLFKRLGFSYDWTREFATSHQDYYKWNQWIFLKFLEKGLAYKEKASVNWCPGCNTVLANEQVIKGKCWRCDSEVEIKTLNQWFFKITDYAQELLDDIAKLEGWPNRVRIMQDNWIGRSEGTMVNFKLKDTGEDIPIFTTRPDTLFGVTFMVFAPEHPKVMELVKGTKYEKDVKEFVSRVVIEERFMRAAEEKEKEGMFIGKHAINPLTGEDIPIYIANFVLMEYGTGMIMAVPAHDQRDFEFAKKYDIPIKVVITPKGKELKAEEMKQAYVDEGVLINSGKFNGLGNIESMKKISEYIEKEGIGKGTVEYKLRDWLISRQRYWGTPIPVVYCDKCGTVPVPEKELPILLPPSEKVDFKAKGNPLASAKEFINTKCPKCKGSAKRETDTMDTFVDSSWYFLRYCSPKSEKLPFEKKEVSYWMPVDQYIGGIEHATGHLIYFRFFTKALRDLGLHTIDEPAKKLLCQGMITLGGKAMSKSRGNVVDPLPIAEKYGADVLRAFILFASSPEKDLEWSDEGIEGITRFLKKFFSLATEERKHVSSAKDSNVISKMHKTIKEVTMLIEELMVNRALVKITEFINYIIRYNVYISDKTFDEAIRNACLLLAPFAPHICEEIWSKKGKGFVSHAKWPEPKTEYIKPKYEAEENLISQAAADIEHIKKISGIRKPHKITFVVSYPWKYEVYNLVLEGKELKEIIKMKEYEKYVKEVAVYVQKLMRRKPLDELFLTAGSELRTLNEAKEFIEGEFDCEVEVAEAEKVETVPRLDVKAKSAEPGKPGILVD